MKSRLQNRFTRVDAVALLAFLAVWIYWIIAVRYGVSFPDEGSYLAMAEQFAHGGRPLVDEWHLSQLPSIFLSVPYKIYVALTGSTDGIVLFMRYLFLMFNAIVYWFVYIRLRAYRWLSVLATILFCIYVPCGIFTCNYYTVPVRLLMIVCLILFSEKQPPPALIIAGVLLSVSVINQPGLALLYFVYSILVWIRFVRHKKNRRFKEEYVFRFDIRAWKYLSAGVLVSAVAFTAWLLLRSGLRNILITVPYLLITDAEHDFSAQGNVRGFFLQKAASAVHLYGLICVVPAILILAFSVAYACGKLRTRNEIAKKSLFCLACIVWILSCVKTFRLREYVTPESFFSMYPAPLLWFGLTCYLLCAHKNKLLLPFWIVGLASSICMDLFSNVVLSMGIPISYVADLVFFSDLVRELRTDSVPKKSRSDVFSRGSRQSKRSRLFILWTSRLTCLCFAAWFGFTLLWENTFVPAHYLNSVPMPPFSFVCQRGPCRSLRYPETYGQNYDDMLSDIDTLKKKQPKNLYVCNLNPELYLYAGLPFSTCSPYTFRTTSDLNRHFRYWTLYPDHFPEGIYVPFDDPLNPYPNEESTPEGILSWIHESFDPLCAYTIEKGKSGYILLVSQWYTNTQTT